MVSHTPASLPAGAPAGARPSTLVVRADEGFGYETMFLLKGHASPIDVDLLRTELEKIGESILVAGDARAVKVHVHNERPDQVIALGLSMGNLTKISVENLDAQSRRSRTAGG
jgi:dihydroxyacetone kinase-like predicted kinase